MHNIKEVIILWSHKQGLPVYQVICHGMDRSILVSSGNEIQTLWSDLQISHTRVAKDHRIL